MEGNIMSSIVTGCVILGIIVAIIIGFNYNTKQYEKTRRLELQLRAELIKERK